MNRFPLAGKTAVVTGGAGGIGFAIASRFAHEGASVVLAGRTQSKLHAALSQLQGKTISRTGIGVIDNPKSDQQGSLSPSSTDAILLEWFSPRFLTGGCYAEVPEGR